MGWKVGIEINNDKNFWICSSLQNKVSEKIISVKLQDTIYVRDVGVNSWGAPMWRAINVSTINEAANEMNDVPSFSSNLKRWRFYVMKIEK